MPFKKNIFFKTTQITVITVFAAAAISVVALAGWIFHIDILTTFKPGWNSMVVNTAIGIVFSGISLLLFNQGKNNWLATVLAFIVFLLGAFSLSEYLFHWNAHIDELIFKDRKTPGDQYPGRMSIATAVAIVMIGISLFTWPYNKKSFQRILKIFASFAFYIAFISFAGYLYGAKELYEIRGYAAISFPTAVSIMLLSAGIFFSKPDTGFLSTFNKPTLAAQTGFRGALITIGIIFIISLLRIHGQHAGFYNTEFALSVMIIIFSICLFFIFWWSANRLNLAEIERDRLNKENEEKAEQVAGVYERVSDAFVALDKNWRFTYVNKKGGELSKRDPVALIGKNIWEEFPEAVGSDTYKAYHKAMADQQYARNIDYNAPLDLWYENNIYPSSEGLSVFVRDINEMKKKEKALAKSDAFSKGVLASLSSCVAVIDERGEIITVNKAWENFATENGVTTLERVTRGANYFDVCNKAAAAGDDIAAQAVKGIQSVLRKEIKVFELQYPCHSPKEQRWFLLRVMLFEADSLMAVVAHNNITEIVLAKQKLEASEKNLRQIMENSSEMIWSIDREHRLITFNKVFSDEYNNFLGVPPSPGNIQYELYPPEAKEVWKVKIEEAFAGNSVLFERSYLSNNEIKHIDIHLHPIKNGNVVEGVTCFVMDITTRKNAEIALSESENYLRTIYQTEPECIKILGPKGELLDMNPAGLAMIEADSLEIVKGKSVLGIIAPKDKDAFVRLTQNVFNGESGILEFEITGLKGTRRWLETHAVPLKDAEGKIISLLSVTRDVTERKKAEEELNKAHKQLLFHVGNTPLGYIEWDNQLFVKSWSKKAEEIFGWTEKEFKDKQKNGFSLVYEEDIPNLKIISQQLMQGTVGQNHVIHRNYTKDGRVIWCEWFNSVLKEKEGNVITIMSQVQNVTERILAEEKIKESEAKYRSLMQQAGDSIVIFDGTGQLLEVNESALQLLGYSGKEYEKMSLKDFVFEEDLKVNPFRFDLLNKGEPTITRRKLKRKDGSGVETELHVKKLSDGRYLGVARDLTERIKAEQKLIDSEMKYRTMVERNLAGIYQTTTEGKILSCNDAFVKILGYGSKNELLQKNAGILYFSGTDRDDFITRLRTKGELNNQELQLKNKNGNPVFIIESCSLQKDLITGMEVIDGVLIDITEHKKAENKIAEKDQQLREISSSIPGFIYQFAMEPTGEFHFLYVSESAKTLIGVTPAEAYENVGNAFAKVHPDDLKGLYESIFASANTLAPWSYTFRVIAEPDKPSKWIRGNSIPKKLENGGILWNGAMFDLTELKLAEEQLSEKEKRFRSLIDTAPDATVIVDEKGIIQIANQQAVKVFGYTKAELTGMPIEILMPKANKHRHESFRRQFVNEPHAREMGLGRDLFALRKDGQVIPVEISLSPFHSDEGVLVTASIRDITERKKADNELKRSEEKYRQLFHNSPLPMWVTEIESKRLIDINEAAIRHYGYSREEFLQMDVWKLQAGRDIEEFNKWLSKNYDDPAVQTGIWQHVRKDKSIIDVEVSSHRIIYEDRPCRLIVANDITERKKAELELEESYKSIRSLTEHLQNIREEERTHIAREIHDELGQQITVMMMDVAWLDRKIDAENTGAKQKIKELLELLDHTVKSVRRISTELRPSVLDDLGLVAAADLHLKEFEKRSGIRTRFIEPETELQLNDQVKNALFRILQESLTNVARHSGAKAATVTLGKKNKKVVLIIEDNGVGFDERKAAAKKTLGVLGMKERAAGIGGEYIISGKPGKGTAITVSVPLQE
jgi:PAS domain S-box-containing protein